MNAADHNEEAPEPVLEGPGKQLREIRIAKGLDINRVASLLHLNVSLLESLEADDFSKLPSSVFVQGYLRNYARLLDIPAGPVLEAFQQCRPVDEEVSNLKAAQIRQEVRSSHTLVRMITWLIVIGIIALVLTWWRGYLQWPLSLGLNGDTGAVAPQAETAPPVTDVQPIGTDGRATLPTLIEKPEILDAPVTDPTSPEESPGETTGNPSRITLQADETEPAVVMEGADSAQAETAGTAAIPPKTEIAVSFSGNCWTDITDASGSYRVIGNKVAGDRIVLAGEAPYTLVFGNAAAVTIRVDGSVYDLAPHTRGNVVKFTFDPE